VYELFDHTADVGLRVRAPDLPRLFCEAAEGLFSVIVEEIPRGVSSRRLDFRLEAEGAEFLLVDWLSELISGAVPDDVHCVECGRPAS